MTMCLLKSNQFSKKLLFFILYICISFRIAHSNNSLIKLICSRTSFPTVCEQLLIRIENIHTSTNKYQLAQCVLQETIIIVARAVSLIDTNLEGNSDEAGLVSCKNVYDAMYADSTRTLIVLQNRQKSTDEAMTLVSGTATSSLLHLASCQHAMLKYSNVDIQRYNRILITIVNLNIL